MGGDRDYEYDFPLGIGRRCLMAVVGLGCLALMARLLYWRWSGGVVLSGLPIDLLIAIPLLAVGLAFLWSAIFAFAEKWVVTVGRIDVEQRNPFLGRKRFAVATAVDANVELEELRAGEEPSVWRVAVATKRGLVFPSPAVSSREDAELVQKCVRQALAG